MSTNYYYTWQNNGVSTKIHIGKRTAGWVFLFRAYPDQELKSFAQWLHFMALNDGTIFDEYGSVVDFVDFCKIVYDQKKEKKHKEAAFKAKTGDYSFYEDDAGYEFCLEEFS